MKPSAAGKERMMFDYVLRAINDATNGASQIKIGEDKVRISTSAC